jgi:F-type H+-transporting ATPase subunit alpha
VLDKGAKNVEILKQNQYSPVKVEEQVAIIYCGTQGLLRDVPVHRVSEFENEFLAYMRNNHSDVLETIKKGIINDEVTGVLDKAVEEVASQFKSR